MIKRASERIRIEGSSLPETFDRLGQIYLFIYANLFVLCLYADISKAKWEALMAANNWNAVELRDNRYNQIVHMVSAANGAEEFYSTEVQGRAFINKFVYGERL